MALVPFFDFMRQNLKLVSRDIDVNFKQILNACVHFQANMRFKLSKKAAFAWEIFEISDLLFLYIFFYSSFLQRLETERVQ